MKKFFGAFAISAVVASSAFASPFNDVPAGHWAYDAVNEVASAGIIKGFSGGLFKGNETVSRYEMALIISRLIEKMHGKNVGTDVRRTMDRLGEEFMDELDLVGARLTALENAFHEHVTTYNNTDRGGNANGFNFSGEARVRFENRTEDQAQAPVGLVGAKDSSSRWQSRVLLDVTKSVSRADFGIQMEYGKNHGSRAGGLGNAASAAGDLDLNQAWVNVKIGDDYGIKAGRQAIELGNGSIIGRYDWLQSPQSYDGLVWWGSTDNFDYKVWSLELSNLGNLAAPGTTNLAAINDTQLNGLDLDFKDVFDGMLHVHYYTLNGAGAAPLAGTVTAGGIGANLDVIGFDWSRDYDDWDIYVQYATQSGNDATAAPGTIDYDGDMWNIKAMYDLDEDDKIGLEYTVYSGDDVSTTAGATNLSYEGWVPVAGDAHRFLGYADVFAQSNIEDITFHWKHEVNERNKFGLAYHMFSLENDRSPAVTLGGGLAAAGAAWNGVATGGLSGAAGAAGAVAVGNANRFNDDLGDELDLWWKHKLSDDVSIKLGYAMFSAGDYFSAYKVAGAGVNLSPDVNYAWISTSVKF